MPQGAPQREPEAVAPVPVEVVAYDPAWVGLYADEAARVRAALGHLVDGGVLEELEHIGSTSVAGLAAKPTIDIMGRVHPYPPSDESIAAIEALGYTWRGEYGLPGRTYFTKGPHEYHLHLVGFDTEHWKRHRVFRDYLRADEAARGSYAALKVDLAERFRFDRPAYQDGKTDLIHALYRQAVDWHVQTTGFTPLERLAAWLEDLPSDGLWAVASGWALDLHLGAPSRYHDDLDLEVDRGRHVEVQHYLAERGWRLDQVVAGGRYAPWPPGVPLAAESHQAHARRDGEFIDLLMAPRDTGLWQYRCDERVTLPLERAVLSARLPSGRIVPYLAPEAVLLFKSRSSQGGGEGGPRGKDAADFARVLPALGRDARGWLVEALRTVHGAHPWIGEL